MFATGTKRMNLNEGVRAKYSKCVAWRPNQYIQAFWRLIGFAQAKGQRPSRTTITADIIFDRDLFTNNKSCTWSTFVLGGDWWQWTC
jgi:hypothetical protein